MEIKMPINDASNQDIEIKAKLDNRDDPDFTWVMTLKRDDFERLVVLAEGLRRPLDFKRKFRIVLEHDPEKSMMEIQFIMG